MLVLHTLSVYSFETHAWSSEICLKEVDTGKKTVVTNDEGASEPTWLGVNDLFLYLHSEDENRVNLIVRDAKNLSS